VEDVVDGRRGGIRRARLIALLAAGAVLAGCAHGPTGPLRTAPPSESVVVASFNFPESELLAEIYAQALEHAGVPVRRESDLGPRELVQPALRQGLVDVVPEYLGTALASVAPHSAVDWTDSDAVLAALRHNLAGWHFLALQPAKATDQNGFAVTRATAARLHLRTLSDLASVRPPLTMGGPSECPRRPYCLMGLKRVYGLQVKQFLPFDDEAQRIEALDERVIDVAVTFTTDGWLATGHLVLLRDDRQLQPIEQVVPVVSDRVMQRYGAQLQHALDAVSEALDSRSLMFLNWRVDLAGGDIRAEARGWLQRHGLLAPAR
jgi:osmoprotectant transport system substrate-binding protein